MTFTGRHAVAWMPDARLPPRSPLVKRVVLICALALCGALLAPVPAGAPALAIVAATLGIVFVFADDRSFQGVIWGPLLGATTMVLASHGFGALWSLEWPVMTATVVRDELLSHLGIPVIILALAYLACSLDDAGIFNWCSLQIMRAGRGSGPRLLLLTFLGVTLLTTFTSNDVVILSVTPILIHLGRNARIQNLTPFLMAQFIAANTASMALFVGNPTNIVIAGAAGIGFVEYARRMLLPTLAASLCALALVYALFVLVSRVHRVPLTYLAPGDRGIVWSQQMTVKAGLFALCLLTLSVVGSGGDTAIGDAAATLGSGGALGVFAPMTLACVGFAAIFGAHDFLLTRACDASYPAVARSSRWSRLPFEIIPFFLGFCVLLEGVQRAGLTEYACDRVVDAFRHGPITGAVTTGMYGIAMVNLTNNIPSTIFFEKVWLGSAHSLGLGEQLAGLDPSYPDIFVDACLYASNFGANLTTIGALAGLMWLRLLRDGSPGEYAGARVPNAQEFFMYGALIVPPVTLATCVVIGLTSISG